MATIRGVFKRGRVELLDSAEIEEGSLLDITVVRSGTEAKLVRKAQQRQDTSVEIRYAFGRSKLSADPLAVFHHVPKTSVPNVRFEGYATTVPCGMITGAVLVALADYTLELLHPTGRVEAAIRKVMRKRKRNEFGGDSQTSNTHRKELLSLLEAEAEMDDAQIELASLAIGAVTGTASSIPTCLKELPELATCLEVDGVAARRGHQYQEQREAAMTRHQDSLRILLIDLLVGYVKVRRRAMSGGGGEDKLTRSELTSIAKRLQASRQQWLHG